MKIDFPRERPTGSFVSAQVERAPGGIHEGGGFARNLRTGMEPVEMRDVSVVISGIVEVVKPFLKLTVPANPQRWEARKRQIKLASQFLVAPQSPACLAAGGEEFPDDCDIHRRADADTEGVAVRRPPGVLGRG